MVETPSNLSKKQIQALNDFRNSLDIEKNFPGSSTFLEAISKTKE
jgi:hypothetical protein